MKLEVASSSETLINNYEGTSYHNPEFSHLTTLRSLLVHFVDALFISTSSCSFPCRDNLDQWLRVIFHHDAVLGLSQF
jgi:hypothetical protein